MNKLFLMLLFFVLQCTSYAQTNGTPVKFKEISYGYYTSQTVEKEQMDNMPAGGHTVVKNQVLVKQTDKIPAKIGTEFGTVYQLKGRSKDSVQLDIEWIYPHEITDPQKNASFKSIKYSLYVPGNATNGSTYSLEEPFEIVTGEWQLNIYGQGELLYSKKFMLE